LTELDKLVLKFAFREPGGFEWLQLKLLFMGLILIGRSQC